MTYKAPFTKWLELDSGKFKDPALIQTRHLSDLKGLFSDSEAETSLLKDNPLIYEVYLAYDGDFQEGQLGYSTTLIYPGKVGNEYFFTKGHYHAKGDRAELYYCIKGEGYLLMQTPEGEVNAQHMTAGAGAYVPPYWGHRTVNTGKDVFVFLAVYPADAGYDYGSIAEKGFASILVENNGKTELVENPKYRA
ncbi:MAG: cupin domain-containing protein [Trueperaceae bacterium]|nr:cupin domain-containing protein [Trueperaceae bacterium]